MASPTFDQWLKTQSLSADAPGVDLARRAWEAASARYVHVNRNGDEEILSIEVFTPVQSRALAAGMEYDMVVGSEAEAPTERDLLKAHLSDAYAAGIRSSKEPSTDESVISARADLLCERLVSRKSSLEARPSDRGLVRLAIASAMAAGQHGEFFATGQAAQGLIDQLDIPAARPASPRP